MKSFVQRFGIVIRLVLSREIRRPERAIEPIVTLHFQFQFRIDAVEMMEELMLQPLRQIQSSLDICVVPFAQMSGFAGHPFIVGNEDRTSLTVATHATGDEGLVVEDRCVGDMGRIRYQEPVRAISRGLGQRSQHQPVVSCREIRFRLRDTDRQAHRIKLDESDAHLQFAVGDGVHILDKQIQ